MIPQPLAHEEFSREISILSRKLLVFPVVILLGESQELLQGLITAYLSLRCPGNVCKPETTIFRQDELTPSIIETLIYRSEDSYWGKGSLVGVVASKSSFTLCGWSKSPLVTFLETGKQGEVGVPDLVKVSPEVTSRNGKLLLLETGKPCQEKGVAYKESVKKREEPCVTVPGILHTSMTIVSKSALPHVKIPLAPLKEVSTLIDIETHSENYVVDDSHERQLTQVTPRVVTRQISKTGREASKDAGAPSIPSAAEREDLIRALVKYDGELLNVLAVSRTVQVADTTARRWIEWLEKLQIIRLIHAYSGVNLPGKRLLQRSIVVWSDVALLATLLDETDSEISHRGNLYRQLLSVRRHDAVLSHFGIHGQGRFDLLVQESGRKLGYVFAAGSKDGLLPFHRRYRLVLGITDLRVVKERSDSRVRDVAVGE